MRRDDRSDRGSVRSGGGGSATYDFRRSPNKGRQSPAGSQTFEAMKAIPAAGQTPRTPLLSGQTFDGKAYTPRSGYSRTAFGGIWEDHKPPDGPWPRALNHCGFSDFDPDEPTDVSTYKYHFSLFYDGEDTAGHMKPNRMGTATAMRAINGYERNELGGYFQRHAFGEPKEADLSDGFRAIPSWGRKIAEPTRPGPGYTRTDMGGYFRT